MNEPVAVSIGTPNSSASEPKPERSAVEEGQILDEGLDLSGYFGTHGSPFVADYFGVKDLYKTNTEIKGMVDSVTEKIIGQTEGQNLVYVAKSILDELGQEINLKDNDAGLFKLKQVLKVMNMKEQAKKLELMKQKVLADIDNMV